jgi:tetratricopeptide (TPR) repeat protein
VGSAACAECHAAEYAAWSGSTHSKAGGEPTRERVIGPFDGRQLKFRDAVVTPSVNARGAFTFTVAQQGRPARTFEVHAVVGGGFMQGGGTQAYFAKFPDGTVRFLPFDYSRSERLFFCNTNGRANRGWVPITPEIALADCGDWPPMRILGSSERFQTCQQCHGSQIVVTSDSATRGFQTQYPTLGINCESCHGPGRAHIDLARSGHIAERVDIGMRSLATLTKDQSLQVCFQCHAAKTALEPGYLPGKSLEEHFALKLPVLLDTIYFPDGRTRSFGYQEGHLASDCYLNGSMTCVDCHDPHTQRYRDVNGVALVGRFDDGQCTSCHASKADSLERHTHHGATSTGSRCVSCHMPYLQQPNVGHRIRYARSDHVIPIPRPLHDTRMGVETACQQCHRDRSAQQLEEQVATWYGELKPLPPAVAGALAADSLHDGVAAARTLLATNARHPIAEITGLAELLERYARPDAAPFDAGTVERLERLARGPDLDVQALALAILHLGQGTDRGVRRFLARELRSLGERDGLVRDRWVWVLVVQGDHYLAAGNNQEALATYRKAEELAPVDPTVLRRLGVAQSRIKDYTAAIDYLRRSLARHSDQPQALLELGFALMQRGDLDSAEAVYRQAITLSPQDAGGYANVALVELRRGETGPAIEALNKALVLDPGLVDAYLLLGRAYGMVGRFSEAETTLRRALEFSPGNPAALRMLNALPSR